MSQENIQQDTQESNQQEYASLEEAVFGSDTNDSGSQTISDVFTTSENKEETEKAPQQGQPQVSGQENNQQPNEVGNDEKRFQYWQSRADKLQNELNSVKQGQVQQQPQQQVQGQPPVEQPIREEFPPPPPKPQQPRTFNREEAHSDPNSESARYLDEVEGWRDNINEYNSLKNQYQNTLLAEKMNSYEQERVENIKRAQVQQTVMQQKNEVANYVMGHHGMNQDEAGDYISKMSNPSSISLDNHVS